MNQWLTVPPYLRQNFTSFIRNIIVAKYINLKHPKSQINLVDIVSKYWSYQSAYYGLLNPVFYIKGDNGHHFEDNLLYADYYTDLNNSNVLVND